MGVHRCAPALSTVCQPFTLVGWGGDIVRKNGWNSTDRNLLKEAQKRVINWNKHYAKIARLETLFILQWAQKNEVLDQCYVILNLLCSTGVCVFCTYRSKELAPPSPKRYSKRINSKFEFQQKLIQFNIWFNNGWPKFNSNNFVNQKRLLMIQFNL